MPAGHVAKPGKSTPLPVGRQAAQEKGAVPAAAASPFDAAGVAASSPFDVGEAEGKRKAAREPAQEALHTEKTRYFVITSNTSENVVKSIRTNLWATQRKNEQKLDEAFKTASAVILVFSVNRSDAFQGYARMRSLVGRPKSRGSDPFNGFGRLFDVEWLRLHDLPYHEVQFSRDGQELSNSCGRKLCGLIDRHIDDPDSFPAPRRPEASGQAWQPPLQSPQLPASGRDSSSGSEGHKSKRKRRRERKYRHAPHPLEDGFDKQVEFFLSLDYEDYVEWWQRFGAVSPGPAPLP
eukprot:TRINITY_DN29016_c0_g1_i1.p1 TRINITY_DN29016_c0_g1~~TRINITY_DN29016_c0_g1_i1.p1  ORF type:complete len:293 (+),score=58.21 TRINITY_DN29016_c0_g1_i1:49-927(+)